MPDKATKTTASESIIQAAQSQPNESRYKSYLRGRLGKEEFAKRQEEIQGAWEKRAKQDESGDLAGAKQGLAAAEQEGGVADSIDQAAHEAATSPKNNLPEPTEAQKEAGNYQKGHATINGLDISIENPAGSRRRPEWAPLKNHYGYIKGTVGKDKDHIDVFLGEQPEDASRPVFVVDQVGKDGEFDEHKVVLGETNEDAARKAYLQNYEKGWTGLGGIKQFTLDEFKDWLKGDTTKPVTALRAKEDAGPISDFGQKIEGARKDYAQAYVEKMKEAFGEDIAKVPLSHSWPEPDYKKLLEEGADPWIVGFIRAARDEIPTKPQKGWKVSRWTEQVRTLRDSSQRILRGDISKEAILRALDESKYRDLKNNVSSRADLYEAVGHEVSLKGVRLAAGRYSILDGKKIDPPRIIYTVERKAAKTAFSNFPQMLSQGDTPEEAIANFKKKIGEMANQPDEGKRIKLILWRERGIDKVMVGVKRGRDYIPLEEYDDVKSARKAVQDDYDALVSKLKKMREIPYERRDTNNPRVGVDHRNGADVTPQQFQETFGFRGGQFGDAILKAKGEAQQKLNETYDALMDLAGILDLPPKALSLNGELAIAFGARGVGGKNAPSAHYEPGDTVKPGNVVINLTRKRGAGSLAHELWHALDNYFTRLRGQKGPGQYLTESAYERGPGIRPEMVDAFKRIVQAVNMTGLKMRSQKLDRARTKPYWATGREMTARSFESYVIEKLRDQGTSNDYLANIVSRDYWDAASKLGLKKEGTYPYPEAAEIPVVREAFDHFFNTVETKETDQGTAMFSRSKREDRTNIDTAMRRVGRFVDEFTAGKVRDEDTQIIGDTPSVLKALGADDLPMEIKGEMVKKVLSGKHKYFMTPDILKQFPEGLYDPLMVFDSPSPYGRGKLILTEITAKNGSPVVIAIHLRKTSGRYLINKIASVYGMEEAEKRLLAEAQSGRLEYYRNEESLEPSTTRRLGINLSDVVQKAQGSNRSLLTENDVVKRFGLSFRRSEPAASTGSRLGHDAVEAIVERVRKAQRLPGNLKFVLHRSEDSLPTAIKEQAKKEGAEGEIDAVYHEGKIHVVTSKFETPVQVEAAILHEALGHYGARRLFGPDLKWAMNRLFLKLGGKSGIKALSDKYGIDMSLYFDTARRQAEKGNWSSEDAAFYLADELLAHMKGKTAGEAIPSRIARIIHEFIGTVRNMLRARGFAELSKVNESDLAYLLRKMGQAAQRSGEGDKGAMFSRSVKSPAMRDSVMEGQPMFSRRKGEEAKSKYAKQNGLIREEHVTAWAKGKKWLKRQFTPGGLLPDKVFREKIKRDSEFEVIEFDVAHMIGRLEKTIKLDYGEKARNLDETTQRLLSGVMAGKMTKDVPEGTKAALLGMRQYIDGLTKQYLDVLASQVADLQAKGNDAKAQAQADLIETIMGNVGQYVHRSYRAFDDKNWAKKVPDEVLDNARGYLLDRYAESDMTKAEAERRAEVVLNEILKHGTAYESMEGFIRESKLGAKDLSVLKKRKQVAPEIRALLGEHTDPRINFSKSATKMGRLIFNQKFLDRVLEFGEGEFLWTDETKPPEATVQIAGEKSEVYAPLNGMWTTPDVAQAFKDALGKEQMADWYRTIVQINGMVKYGKAQPLTSTVYTPSGPVAMGALRIGDEVCGANGRTRVTGIFPQGALDTYRIKFSDGAEVEASGEHLWEVNICDKRNPRVMTTDDLRALPEYRFAKRQISVPVAEAEFDAQDVPIDPYTLGALLGDGSFRSPATVRFSSADQEILDLVANGLPPKHMINQPSTWAACDYSIVSKGQRDNEIRIELAKLGLWGKCSKTKFIPDIYKYNSRDVRLGVVRGLLDTDGWVVRDGQPALSVSNERLARDFAYICTSLGWPCENASDLFSLKRKAEKCLVKKKPVHRTIVSIEPIGRQECQCIRIDDDRHLYMTDGFVLTHNTVLSPTTAARNWFAAFFFSVANGHFDMRDMAKSVSVLREYFGHGGVAKKLAYLRELKKLGVIYDTPYAGEMMRLLADSRIEDTLIRGKRKMDFKQALEYATKFYQYGDDFHKIIGFESEKRRFLKLGLSEREAKEKAAERVRNTYPTYSMTGRGIKSLSRFPLEGTFVSFPAEIIRTSGNMLRYLAQDMKDPKTRPMARQRAVGLAVASSFAYALQAVSMAMLGYDDDDDEAARLMAAPWQRNSNLLYTGRDKDGNIRYLDLSFLDPYNYWKRPIMAIARNQPWRDSARDAAKEMLTPFLGTDIAAGAISAVLANKKDSGAPVYKEHDEVPNQAADIVDHLRKALQPGIASNLERTWKAIDGDVSPSGRKYDKYDEAAAWVGFRMSTLDPKVSLYYRSFDFKDAKAAAGKKLSDVIRQQKGVDSDDLRSAYDLLVRLREKAYREMISLAEAAKKAGMSRPDIARTLKNSGVSRLDIGAILHGKTPSWRPTLREIQEMARKARTAFGPGADKEVVKRYREVISYARSSG